MAIIVGSARIDERGKLSGGQLGDQKQMSSTNDTKGEVSMQAMYNHSKGLYILRPIEVNVANKIAEAMIIACNNPNIGYDQGKRVGVVTNGVASKVKTGADCSTLVRACCKYAGFDPGNFSTADEANVLEKSGRFEKRIAYVSQAKTPVYNGDVLVTKTKGHTMIVVKGSPRPTQTNSYSKVTFLKECAQALGVPNTTGTEILKKTITISKKTNSKHPVVKCIQRRLISLGISCGPSGDDGDFGKNTEKAVKELQTKWTKNPDGIITANNSTWKYLLGIL